MNRFIFINNLSLLNDTLCSCHKNLDEDNVKMIETTDKQIFKRVFLKTQNEFHSPLLDFASEKRAILN